ncbi:helix-turn-helix transcriptional regulator [Arthrobacter sp. KK5.5]|uniref:helix-turn-helix transcriptional regulator n=1 Tax=Arthrobacter sp. KK5.5 TaxID=3373084 RepID=UPI003EE5766C
MGTSLSAPTLEALQSLGRHISVERRQARWTQAELAERAGISTGTLAAVEKGSQSPSIGTVFEIATLLGIPLVAASEPATRRQLEERLAVLPTRVRHQVEIDDDF